MRFEPESTGPIGTSFAGEPRVSSKTAVEPDVNADETIDETGKPPAAKSDPVIRQRTQTLTENHDPVSPREALVVGHREVVLDKHTIPRQEADSGKSSSSQTLVSGVSPVTPNTPSAPLHARAVIKPRVMQPVVSPPSEQRSTEPSSKADGLNRSELRRERPSLQTRSTAIPQAALQSSTVAQATETAPTIHVSIGRIEVRAVTTPSSRPSTPRNPAMSIDEYSAKRLGRR